MLKKILLLGAIALSIVQNVYADAVYVGGGGGGRSLHDKLIATNVSLDAGNLGFIGGIFLGYRFDLPEHYKLAFELFGNGSTARANMSGVDLNTNTSTTGNAYVKSRYNYGIRALPAYMLTSDTDMHLLLGYVRDDIRFNATDTINVVGA